MSTSSVDHQVTEVFFIVLRRGTVSRVTAGLIEGHHNDTGKPRSVDVPASIENENVGLCFLDALLSSGSSLRGLSWGRESF